MLLFLTEQRNSNWTRSVRTTFVNITPAIADPEFPSFVAFLCRDEWGFMVNPTDGPAKKISKGALFLVAWSLDLALLEQSS